MAIRLPMLMKNLWICVEVVRLVKATFGVNILDYVLTCSLRIGSVLTAKELLL